MELDWEDLRLFDAAWTHGSLTAAAEALGIGQATMSRRIAALEERLGHVLFDRHRSGLRPTRAAELLHPHVEAMAAASRDAAAAIEGFEVDPVGVVRLAVPPGVATDVIPPLLPALRERHPGLRLELVVALTAADLSRREADIALRSVPTTDPDLVMRRLPDVPLGVFASPTYVAALPPKATADDLDWVQWSASMLHIPMAEYVEALRVRPPVLTADSFVALTAAARHGLGCFVTTDLQARTSGLVPVPVALPPLPEVPWFMVCHGALRRVPRVRAVMDFLTEAIEAAREGGDWPPAM